MLVCNVINYLLVYRSCRCIFLQRTGLVQTLQSLYSRPLPNPDPEAAKRSSPVVGIVVLKRRTEGQLVGVEVQPPIPDGHTVRVLDHGIPYESSDDIILCWNGT
jgi:hypothetical protein